MEIEGHVGSIINSIVLVIAIVYAIKEIGKSKNNNTQEKNNE